jgi:hypothetical protein
MPLLLLFSLLVALTSVASSPLPSSAASQTILSASDTHAPISQGWNSSTSRSATTGTQISAPPTTSDGAMQTNTSAWWVWDLPSGAVGSTTCTWGDTACSTICSRTWHLSSASWSSWTEHNVVMTALAYNSWAISRSTCTQYNVTSSVGTSQLTYSATTSTYSGAYVTYTTTRDLTTSDEGTQTYIYALGTGYSTTTETPVLTYPTFHISVLSTLKKPPSCTYQICDIQPNPKDASCRPCEVQGGTVDLLYWADLATPSLSGKCNSSTSGPVTAMYRNTTLTSPTVSRKLMLGPFSAPAKMLVGLHRIRDCLCNKRMRRDSRKCVSRRFVGCESTVSVQCTRLVRRLFRRDAGRRSRNIHLLSICSIRLPRPERARSRSGIQRTAKLHGWRLLDNHQQ